MSSPSARRRPERLGNPLSPTPGNRSISIHNDPSIYDRRRFRRSSNASITSSIGGTLDTATQDTSELNDLSQNAISTLLSHPIVRTGLVPQNALSTPAGHRPPSIRDIPPVSLTPIPHVENSAFRPYLSTVGPLYDTYQRSKSPVEEPLSPRTPRAAPADYFSRRRESSSSSVPATPRTPGYLASPTSPSTPRRPTSAHGGSRRDPHAPTPLSTIPPVYFEENFQLENPRIFDVVSERSDVIPPDPNEAKNEAKGANGSAKAPARTGRRALHTNAILQEKLSWYMDTVEVHLIQSIASASSSFFTALGSLKDLQSEATESIEKIRGLREALKRLDKEMALGGLEVVKMRRRRDNLRKLSDAVKQLCDVMEEATKCEELVEGGSLDDATARMDALENMIAGKTSASEKPRDPPRIDLRRLRALDRLSEGISQLRHRAGRGYEGRFVEALLVDLRHHVEQVPPQETLQRWASSTLRGRGDHNRAKSGVPAYMKPNERLRPELMAALDGLARSGDTSHAAVAYREAMMREIKSLIRKYLPSSNDDDAESTTSISTRGGGRKLNQQEKSAILARNLRALDAESFEELLVKVYTTVGEALRRIGTQVKVVLDVTSSVEPPTSPQRTSRDIPSIQVNQLRDEVTSVLDMSSLLGQAVDTIQTQVTKVLKVRSEQNARLPLQQFLRYFILNRLFTDECEAVSSRGGESLKDVVNSQVREFLLLMADTERQSMVKTLEADQWEAQDFSPPEQVVLDRVLESMDRTPKPWTSYTSLWEPAASTNGTQPVANGTTDEATPRTRSAKIDEQAYILVHSTIMALHMIESYLTLMAAIPSLTVDSSQKLLDYLKAFNSRCTQLILGAGATKSAGLKNITTKHLALASQTCSFLIALMPYLRECVRRTAGPGGGGAVSAVLPEFDKVKRNIQDHQSSIHEKLVDIMSQRSNLHVKAMKKIDWDAPAAADTVNSYAETLAKETGTLHRVLGRHVGDLDLQMIMVPIFGQYSQEWTRAFDEAVVTTEGGKRRMLADLTFLDSKLSRIETSGDFVKNLISLVKKKEVQQQQQQQQQQQLQAPAPAPPPATSEAPPNSTQSTTATAPEQQRHQEQDPEQNPKPNSNPKPTDAQPTAAPSTPSSSVAANPPIASTVVDTGIKSPDPSQQQEITAAPVPATAEDETDQQAPKESSKGSPNPRSQHPDGQPSAGTDSAADEQTRTSVSTEEPAMGEDGTATVTNRAEDATTTGEEE